LVFKNYYYFTQKKKFEGCHLQPSQRELADKTKSWPDKKKYYVACSDRGKKNYSLGYTSNHAPRGLWWMKGIVCACAPALNQSEYM